jgi:hypothetical protein
MNIKKHVSRLKTILQKKKIKFKSGFPSCAVLAEEEREDRAPSNQSRRVEEEENPKSKVYMREPQAEKPFTYD